MKYCRNAYARMADAAECLRVKSENEKGENVDDVCIASARGRRTITKSEMGGHEKGQRLEGERALE